MAAATNIVDTILQFCEETDSDLLFYIGDLRSPQDEQLLALCEERKARTNLILFLTTYGGDPHATYRIGRCLQRHYLADTSVPGLKTEPSRKSGSFAVFVNGLCKSAGTILACAASKIYMTRRAQFGPIDVQLRKTDEVGERISGLTPMQALNYLQNQSVLLFKRHFTNLRFDEDLLFSTKMSAEIATNITVGLLGPIYSQLDPMRLAENDRYMRVASEYARRLATNNVHKTALERLVGDYPSHSFVIDSREAPELFVNIEEPPEKLHQIGEVWRAMADDLIGGPDPFLLYMNDWAIGVKEEQKKNQTEEAKEQQETGDATQNADGAGVRDSDRQQPATHAGGYFKTATKYANRI